MLLVALLGGVLLANLLHMFGLQLPGSSAAVIAATVLVTGWVLQAATEREDGRPEPADTEAHLVRALAGVREMVRQTVSGMAGLALLGTITVLVIVGAVSTA